MQRRIPVAVSAAIIARVFNEGIHRLHGVAGGLIRNIWNAQVNRGDAGEALIVGVQCARHSGKAGHEPVGADVAAIGAAEQPLDVALSTDDELSVAFFDQRRAADE
jgi:hypothetical protein